MKNLIYPINDAVLTAGYKNKQYLQAWGFNHFGCDFVSRSGNREVLASADGEIIAFGMDGKTPSDRLGNCMVVSYPEHVARYFHLDRFPAGMKVGKKVKRGEVIAYYGNTGKHTSGPHLHFELDTDKDYPRHAYGIGSSGNVIMKGTIDSTVSPIETLRLAEGQTYGLASNGWYSATEKTAKKLETVDYKAKYNALLTALRKLLGV